MAEEPVEMVIPRPWVAFIRDPFRFITAHESFLFGLIIILLTGFIGSLGNTHVDGVLDVHTGARGPLWVFLLPGFINWLALSAPLYVAGLILAGRRTRLNDLLGYQAFARMPMLVAVLFTLIPGFQRQAMQPTVFTDDTAVFGVVLLVIIVMIVLMAVWMYRGFLRAAGLTTSAKAVVMFIAALFIAEAISKLTLYYTIVPALTPPPMP